MVKDFIAQSDIEAQKTQAKAIQELLLDETPIIIPYFYDFLTGVRKGDLGGRDDRHGPRPADRRGQERVSGRDG